MKGYMLCSFKKREIQFLFNQQPYYIIESLESGAVSSDGKHYALPLPGFHWPLYTHLHSPVSSHWPQVTDCSLLYKSS